MLSTVKKKSKALRDQEANSKRRAWNFKLEKKFFQQTV